MSFEWPLVRLGDLISLKGGFAYKGEFLGLNGAVLLGMGVVSHSERFLKDGIRRYRGELPSTHRVSAGDMVIATRQQSDNLPILGCPALVPKDLPSDDIVVGTNLYKVTNTSDLENQFLYWLLRGKEYRRRIIDCSKGTTVRMITKDAIEDFCFLCPPSETRNEITKFLNALDERITLLHETNVTLEAIAQALFKSWFVDFDPVRAKSEGKLPEGMDEATAAFFPDAFQETELGVVPRGWQVKFLSEKVKISYGKNLPTNNLLEFGYPVYGGNGQIGFIDKYLYESRQVLVSCRGAASGKFNQTVPKSFVTNNSLVLESGPRSEIPFGYLKGCILSADLAPFVTGSAQPQVTIDNLKNFKFLFPLVEILQIYENYSSVIEDRIEANTQNINVISGLRDTLLPRLISGQLRITDAEAELEKTTA